MKKTFTYRGEALSDERAEEIATEALADLDTMNDAEARRRTRPFGDRSVMVDHDEAVRKTVGLSS